MAIFKTKDKFILYRAEEYELNIVASRSCTFGKFIELKIQTAESEASDGESQRNFLYFSAP